MRNAGTNPCGFVGFQCDHYYRHLINGIRKDSLNHSSYLIYGDNHV